MAEHGTQDRADSDRPSQGTINLLAYHHLYPHRETTKMIMSIQSQSCTSQSRVGDEFKSPDVVLRDAMTSGVRGVGSSQKPRLAKTERDEDRTTDQSVPAPIQSALQELLRSPDQASIHRGRTEMPSGVTPQPSTESAAFCIFPASWAVRKTDSCLIKSRSKQETWEFLERLLAERKGSNLKRGETLRSDLSMIELCGDHTDKCDSAQCLTNKKEPVLHRCSKSKKGRTWTILTCEKSEPGHFKGFSCADCFLRVVDGSEEFPDTWQGTAVTECEAYDRPISRKQCQALPLKIHEKEALQLQSQGQNKKRRRQ